VLSPSVKRRRREKKRRRGAKAPTLDFDLHHSLFIPHFSLEVRKRTETVKQDSRASIISQLEFGIGSKNKVFIFW
jgi:hypothetical protein